MDALPQVREWTFCIVKPDALLRGIAGRIITRIEDTHLRVTGFQTRHKSPDWARNHYLHLQHKPFFPQLVEFMTAHPILGFLVSGPCAIKRMRALAGNTLPHEAAPGTIRGDFGGYPAMYNCIHVSDSLVTAQREHRLFMDVETDQVYKDLEKNEDD